MSPRIRSGRNRAYLKNPGAWLTTAAKRRRWTTCGATIGSRGSTKSSGREMEAQRQADVDSLEAAMDDEFGDDLLRLMFVACHSGFSGGGADRVDASTHGGLTTGEMRARTWRRKRPSRSVSCAPSEPSPRSGYRSRSLAELNWARGFRRCSKSFIWSLMRATRQPLEPTGCGPRSARTRSGWGEFSRSWLLPNQRFTAWLL